MERYLRPFAEFGIRREKCLHSLLRLSDFHLIFLRLARLVIHDSRHILAETVHSVDVPDEAEIPERPIFFHLEPKNPEPVHALLAHQPSVFGQCLSDISFEDIFHHQIPAGHLVRLQLSLDQRPNLRPNDAALLQQPIDILRSNYLQRDQFFLGQCLLDTVSFHTEVRGQSRTAQIQGPHSVMEHVAEHAIIQ